MTTDPTRSGLTPAVAVLRRHQHSATRPDLSPAIVFLQRLQGAIMAVGASRPSVVANADGFFNVKNKMLPPRPPRGLSLDAADQKLIKEIAELAEIQRAWIERMMTLKELKVAKASSTSLALNGSSLALLFTVFFFFSYFLKKFSSELFRFCPIRQGTGEQIRTYIQFLANSLPFQYQASVPCSSKLLKYDSLYMQSSMGNSASQVKVIKLSSSGVSSGSFSDVNGRSSVPPLLRYGKYCGIMYSGCPGEQPCDGLDACCMTHDLCIQHKGKVDIGVENLFGGGRDVEVDFCLRVGGGGRGEGREGEGNCWRDVVVVWGGGEGRGRQEGNGWLYVDMVVVVLGRGEVVLSSRTDGGNLVMLRYKLASVELSRFYGEHPDAWVFQVERDFTFYSIIPEQQLSMASFYSNGTALEWELEDPEGRLTKLCQTFSVADYQARFEAIANETEDKPNTLMVKLFVSGLRLVIKTNVLVHKSNTLDEAISLAHTHEQRLNLKKGPMQPFFARTQPLLPSSQSRSLAPSRNSGVPSVKFPIKHLSPVEMQYY
ncbi:hypothetical protein FXO37_30564 [Capsicum annuum]|nr:hypothetical protein FXO37_30564 [Capsicum annuum]